MEKMDTRSFLRMDKILWIILILFRFAMMTSIDDPTTVKPELQKTLDVDDANDSYAWSSWGSWSPCSRTCGGGVSVQERQCISGARSKEVTNSTVSVPDTTGRVAIQGTGCVGVDKRYHECNTAPCPGGDRDWRFEQCSFYNRRPFRGQFYTWIPYVDGNSPCTLNCRPLGHQFYASLASVADGTPCTRPGFRAICVQGTCKVITQGNTQ